MALPGPATITEFRHSGGFIVREANGTRSRDAATFVNTGTADILVTAGTVLALAGESTVDATYIAGTNTGNFTFGSLTFGAAAKTGQYVGNFTAATVFTVRDPDGNVLTTVGATGSAFTDAQLGFTVTAGTTAAVSGDTFTIDVPNFDTAAAAIANTVVALGTGDTGNGTLSNLQFGVNTSTGTFMQPGTWTITFSSATAFSVKDPTGAADGSGTVGTAFTSTRADISFLITAGTVAFVNTDTITVTVPNYGNAVQNWKNAAPAYAIAFNSQYVPALGQRQMTVISRECEVNGSELVWDSTITTAAQKETAFQQLQRRQIIVR